MVWMDEKEPGKGLKKQLTVETVRPPLRQTERSNGVAAHRARIREVSSRYMSTSINNPSAPNRYPSPVPRSAGTPASVVVPKRAVSAERKRPSTPTSSSRPSTPVRDIDVSLPARKTALSKQPERVWPSTMRGLNASFQSDGIPTPKKEKPGSHTLCDSSLRFFSNSSHKKPESPRIFKKETPQRSKSPLKGKCLFDQAENAKYADSPHARSIDQHRWPSIIGGRVSSGFLNRSIDITDKIIRNSSASLPRIGIPSARKLSDGITKPIHRTSSEASDSVPSDPNISDRRRHEKDISSDSSSLKLPELRKLTIPAVRSQSLPGSRQPSPIRTSSQSKVASPSHSRPSTPTRGLSPSRTRPLGSSSQTMSSASVLNFINPKKNNQLEDAHQLRLLYNRHLQWRFANARTDISMRMQKVTAERSLNNVWRTNLSLWDSVVKKKIRLQQMRFELKLNSILNEQLQYLEDWEAFGKDYSSSLVGVTNDLEASTLRLPLTSGAKANIKSLKIAIGSVMDVMQSMGPSVINLLSKAEGMNTLVSHLADLAVREKAMLGECEAMLALNAAMQVEENSLRTHLIQTYAIIDKC